MTFTYFYDASYLLSYIVLYLHILLLSHSDFWRDHVKPILIKYFFNEKLLNPMLTPTGHHGVKMQAEISHNKTQQELMEAQG
jgi:hypothetical protein